MIARIESPFVLQELKAIKVGEFFTVSSVRLKPSCVCVRAAGPICKPEDVPREYVGVVVIADATPLPSDRVGAGMVIWLPPDEQATMLLQVDVVVFDRKVTS